MSLVFKCDRCGDIYEMGDSNAYGGIGRYVFYGDGSIRSSENPMNWCPRCMRAFEKFETDLDMEYRPTVNEILNEVEQMAIRDRLSLGKAMTFKDILPSVYQKMLVEKKNKEVFIDVKVKQN